MRIILCSHSINIGFSLINTKNDTYASHVLNDVSSHIQNSHSDKVTFFQLNTILFARAKVILLIILFLCNQCTAVVK